MSSKLTVTYCEEGDEVRESDPNLMAVGPLPTGRIHIRIHTTF